ncbi:MAG: sirohydrochlorin chelatase [Candidatus Margulisiibacteriota bacterium]
MLFIIVHGSRDPKWCEPFRRFVDDLALSASSDAVRLCFMEIVSPTLMDVATEAYNAGKRSATVLPFFMAGGGHVDHDIPVLVQEVRDRYPDFNIEQIPPIGQHEAVLAQMKAVALSLLS